MRIEDMSEEEFAQGIRDLFLLREYADMCLDIARKECVTELCEEFKRILDEAMAGKK